MRYLFVLRGIPASGKSTFIKEENLDTFTLSSDDYRLKLSAPIPSINTSQLSINFSASSRAFKNLYQDLEYRMQHGELTIVDATHTTKKSFDKYRELCKKYFYRMFVVEFNVDVDTCIERDKYRRFRKVGEEVIRRMSEQMKEKLTNSMNIISPSEIHCLMDTLYSSLDFNKYDKIHVIGDIHGCYSALKEFISKNVNEEKDAVIFVGDYFDRGIENYEVFNYIYNHLDKNNFFFLMGNHDRRIVKYLADEDVYNTQFYRNTLKQFQDNNVTNKMLRKFCHSLIPCAYFTYNNTYYIVSHAGLNIPIVNIAISDDYYVQGIGDYSDMEKVCKQFKKRVDDICHQNVIQIFGHRNNNDVPIKINDRCYNVCGFPEYGGTLKSVTISTEEIKEHYIQNNVFSRELYYDAINRYPSRFEVKDIPTLLGAFRHNKYVKETGFEGISSFQFTKDAFYEGNWNTIINHARGLFINIRTSEIVARSYDKFFLLGQYDYCTLDKFMPPFTVYEKYDGFLGIIGYDKESDQILYCSKSTLYPYGDYAKIFYNEIHSLIKDEQALKNFLKTNNCSMIFECIAPNIDPHIVHYSCNFIVLLDIVENTIEYKKPFDYDTYEQITNDLFYNIEVKEFVEKYQIIFDMIDILKSKEGIEGYVIEDANGKMFKLKTYEYEAGKILRNIKDVYTKIKEQAGEHEIKCPSVEKIKEQYCKFYDDIVVDTVVIRTPSIIDAINKGE